MLRCACGHGIAGWGVIVAPEVDHACRHGDDERPDRGVVGRCCMKTLRGWGRALLHEDPAGVGQGVVA